MYLVAASSSTAVQQYKADTIRTAAPATGAERKQLHWLIPDTMDLLALPEPVFVKIIQDHLAPRAYNRTGDLASLAATCWKLRHATIHASRQLSVYAEALMHMHIRLQQGRLSLVQAKLVRHMLDSLGEGVYVIIAGLVQYAESDSDDDPHLTPFSPCLVSLTSLAPPTQPLLRVARLELLDMELDGFPPSGLPASFPNLHELLLTRCDVGSSTCSKALPKLHTLLLVNTPLLPAQIKQLPGLQQLDLCGPAPCAGMSEYMLGLTALTRLWMWRPAPEALSAKAQDAIGTCSRLQDFSITTQLPLTLPPSGSLLSLTSLSLTESTIGDRDMQQLVQLPQVTQLSVGGFQLSVDQSSHHTAWQQVSVHQQPMSLLSLLYLPLHSLQKGLHCCKHFTLPTAAKLGSLQLSDIQQLLAAAAARAAACPAGVLACAIAQPRYLCSGLHTSVGACTDVRVAAFLPALRTLDDHRGLFMNVEWSAAFVQAVCSPVGCKDWKELSLDHCTVTVQGLHAVLAHMPCVRQLVLSSCSGQDAVGLMAFFAAADRSRQAQVSPVPLTVQLCHMEACWSVGDQASWEEACAAYGWPLWVHLEVVWDPSNA